jgi:hypothetical protein
MPVTPFRAGGTDLGLLSPNALDLAATTTNTYLVDVSEFEPNVADAVYLAWSKAIVIRAAYGDAHDDHAWYGGARRSALHAGGAQFLGIYQYLVAGQDGTAQANALHDLVGGLQKGEVLIADFEEGSKPMLTAWYNRMLALGYADKFLWTYSGLFFGQAQGALPVQWLADYTSVEPSSPHTLWQFTSAFNVPGVGPADCSVYHGPVSALAALAYGGAVAPPPAPVPAPAPGNPRQSTKPGPSAVTFAWDAVAGKTSYHFQLEWWKPSFGWDLSTDQQVTGTSVTIGLGAASKYRWRVAAGTSDYTWSDWNQFDTP